MMRRRGSSLLSHTGGASAVEFALVITPLLLLLFGAIEFGRLLWTRQAIQSVVASTARCMGVLQSGCAKSGAYNAANATKYAIAAAASYGVSLTATNISLNASAKCGGVSGFSTASITYTFVTPAPFIAALAGGQTLTIAACFPNQS